MAARLATRGMDVWSTRGLGWVAPEQGFSGLQMLLTHGVTHGAVLSIDWRQFLKSGPGVSDWFRLVSPSSRTAHAVSPATAPKHDSLDAWRAAPAGHRRSLIIESLAAHARAVLGLDPSIGLDERMALKEVGLDSLMAVEMRNVLTRSVGRSLPATLLFDYPTIDALATYLMRVLELEARPAASPPAADGEARAALAELSDAEAEAQLLAELESGSPGNKE